jgi:hypothetical protein
MLQEPDLELQLVVGFGKLPGTLRDAKIEFAGNPSLLAQEARLLQRDGRLIRSNAKNKSLGLLRKICSLASCEKHANLTLQT